MIQGSPDNVKATSARNQIMALVDRMPSEMQVKLLRFLEAKIPRHIKGNLVIEKRADFRRDCLISVEYRVQGKTYESFILDISAFGVFIETDDHFDVGNEIHLEFSLPRYKDAFILEGAIVWSGSQGVGVQFTSLNESQVKQLRSFSEEKSQTYTIVS